MNNYLKYLKQGSVEENWGLHVDTAGFSRVKPNQNYPQNWEHPSTHTFSWNKGRVLNGYQLLFISKGSGIFESEFAHRIEVTEGTCLFLHSGVWHRYKPNPESGWAEYWIGFNGQFADELMNKGFFTADLPFIKVGMNTELLQLFHKLLETIDSATIGYQQIIAGITMQILGVIYSISLYKGQETTPVGRLIEKAKFMMEESIEKPVDLEQMAKELTLGYSTFRKEFKRLTGEPPNQFLLNLRLSKARYLLESTKMNINEISDKTGFESVYYFSKLFKKRNGKSPKSYREEIIK